MTRLYIKNLSLEDFCNIYAIEKRGLEEWYDINNEPILKDCKISNYGRLKLKNDRIKTPLEVTKSIKYLIIKEGKVYYFRAYELMCKNIPELFKEDKYLGIPIYKNKNSNDCYIDNIIPRWSKANISDKDSWKKIDGFDLLISNKGDLIRESNKDLLNPKYKKNTMLFYIQNKVMVNLTKVAYVLFHLNKSLKECQDFLNDENIRFMYKDKDNTNFSVENIYI